MSKKSFVGRSEFTESKQAHLRYFLDTHVTISKSIIKRHDWMNNQYYYADICAGDGGDDEPGSPLIFTDIQNKHGLNCRPFFIERNPDDYYTLKSKLNNDYAKCINKDHSYVLMDTIPRGRKQKTGVLYFDPNGDPFVKNADLLPDFFSHKNTQRIDLLLYYSGTTIKRVLKASATKRDWDLSGDISRIGKKFWLIREPQGRAQWSFLFGTNWDAYPDFKKLGFYKTDSLEGKKILNKINYTAQELIDKGLDTKLPPKQLNLF